MRVGVNYVVKVKKWYIVYLIKRRNKWQLLTSQTITSEKLRKREFSELRNQKKKKKN